MNYLYIALIVFAVTAVIGISLGLYLTKFCYKECDENHEHESGYCDDER